LEDSVEKYEVVVVVRKAAKKMRDLVLYYLFKVNYY
jgi:hypothetical protein